MIAASDYTLSDSHFSQPRITVSAEYKDRPRYSLPLQNATTSSATSTVLFFVVAIKAANSISYSPVTWTNTGESITAIKIQQDIDKIKLLNTLKMKINGTGVSSDIDSLSETVESAFEIISRFGAESIDLKDFQQQHINGEHLASLLRVTYHNQSNLVGWRDALELAVNALEKEGIDAQDALAGMI